MSVNKLLLKAAAPIPKIDRYDKYLFIGPHPDDIEIGAGATAARLCAEGKEVVFLICTDGRFGTKDEGMDLDRLVEIRKREQLDSAAILGVSRVIFLPFEDGGLYSVEELRAKIAKVIVEVEPDVVLCPDFTLETECHPDHLKTGRAAAEAYLFSQFFHSMKAIDCPGVAAPKALAFYYTARPNRYVASGKYFHKMLAALRCYKSQFPIEDDKDGEFKGLTLYLNLRSRINGLRSFKGRAEAFRAMHNLHIHCCPEAENR